MRQQKELEGVRIALQDNGEGVIGFTYVLRVRDDDGKKLADGAKMEGRIRLADNRERAFTLASGKTINGAEHEEYLRLAYAAHLVDVEAQEAERAAAAERAKQKAAIVEDMKRQAEQAAEHAEQIKKAEAAAIAEKFRGKAQPANLPATNTGD